MLPYFGVHLLPLQLASSHVPYIQYWTVYCFAAGCASLNLCQLCKQFAINHCICVGVLLQMPCLEQLRLGRQFEVQDEGLAALGACLRLSSLTLGNFNITQPVSPSAFPALKHMRVGAATCLCCMLTKQLCCMLTQLVLDVNSCMALCMLCRPCL